MTRPTSLAAEAAVADILNANLIAVSEGRGLNPEWLEQKLRTPSLSGLLKAMRLVDAARAYEGDNLGEVSEMLEEAARLASLTPATDERLAEALADLTDAFLSRHGCFPLDRVTPEQQHWHRAMKRAYELVGQPGTPARDTALANREQSK